MIGPVLDASGVAVTDSVVGDFKISKNGGAPAALNGSATLTHRHTGNYSLALTASDLDTVGTAQVTCDDTTNACQPKDIAVIEEAVYDAIFASAAAGYQVPIWAAANSTVNLSGTTVKTLTDAPADSSGVTTLLTRVTAAVALASSLSTVEGKIDTIDGIVDAILVDTGTDIPATLSTLATAANLATVAGYIDTEIGSIITSLSTIDTKINTIDGIVDSILEDTGTTLPASIGDIPTNAELATALGTADDATLAAIAALNNLSAAQVLQQAKDALVFYDLDHLLAVDYNPASKPGVATALLNELIESDGGVSRFTANALEQAPAGGGGGGSLTADQDAALTRIDRTVKGLASRKDV